MSWLNWLNQPIATLIAGVAAAAGSTAVGVTAIVFGARQARRALDQQGLALEQQRVMAADARQWEARRGAYEQLAEWLVEHPVVEIPGAAQPSALVRAPEALWTADPGPELMGKMRLFATDEIVELVVKLSDTARREPVVLAMVEKSTDSASRGERGFFTPEEGQRAIAEVRNLWERYRADLEGALRNVY